MTVDPSTKDVLRLDAVGKPGHGAPATSGINTTVGDAN